MRHGEFLPGPGVQIARLASDRGAAIRAMATKLAGVEHQLDPWHALQHVAWVVGSLERAAYTAIAREEELGRKAKRKSLGQAFLDLFTLYRDSHAIQCGKRAGASPFQLADIHTPEDPWTNWLDFGHGQTPRLSVRSLPKAA